MLRLQKTLGITTLIVTHDQEEAQSLASSLVLMNKGRIEQIDTPMAVYDRPQTLFVNSFIGQANQFEATVEALEPMRRRSACAPAKPFRCPASSTSSPVPPWSPPVGRNTCVAGRFACRQYDDRHRRRVGAARSQSRP